MKVEEGKTYRDADGNKIGPMTPWHEGTSHCWQWQTRDGAPVDQIYRADGTSSYNPALVAEWPASPVRTVTKKEIVSGTYGRLVVGSPVDGRVDISFGPFSRHYLDIADLTAAIETLTAIRDVLAEAA